MSWRDKFQTKYCGEIYRSEVEEDFRGYRGCYQEVLDFIEKEVVGDIKKMIKQDMKKCKAEFSSHHIPRYTALKDLLDKIV